MPVIVTVGGQFSGSFDLYASRAENFPAGDPLGSSCNLETGTGGSEHGAMPSQPGCKQGCFEAFPMQGTLIKRDGGELRWSLWMFGVLMTLTMIPEQSREKTRLTIIQP
ncbi:hypothetical protein FALCPG4_012038 [Fusarium falciforme]